MKLIQPQAELLSWIPGTEGVYRMVELAGRTCYKSTDKITDDSAKPFVDRMIASHHTAMLEHGTVYLCAIDWDNNPLRHYWGNKYSKVKEVHLETEHCQSDTSYKYAYYVTTNLRVLVENGWLNDLKYICDPTEHHEMRYSFKLITSIGVTREFNRHRVDSIAEQSTRYCNYAKDKFGGEVTFCIPSWIGIPEGIYNTTAHLTPNVKGTTDSLWFNQLSMACDAYLTLIQEGWQPQQAREVLPLCTATEIVHTAFASDWRHFFDLRLFGKTGAPHPNMKQLAELMEVEARMQGIWDDIMSYKSKFEDEEK